MEEKTIPVLATWEILVQQISFGFLILGIILFLVSTVSEGLHLGEFETSAPLFLLAAVFLVAFGSTGVSLYSVTFDPTLRLILVIGAPIIAVVVVATVWKRFGKTSLYDLPELSPIDSEVKALTDVDDRGGMVSIDVGPPQGKIKAPAKTLGGVLFKGMTGYVIDYEGKFLIVDQWPLGGESKDLKK